MHRKTRHWCSMACFVDTEHEILVLKYHMSWLGPKSLVRHKLSCLPSKSLIFSSGRAGSPSNKQELAAEANLRQTHTHALQLFGQSVSMQKVCICDTPSAKQCYANLSQDSAGTADAYVDLNDVHKFWPNARGQRIRILHSRHLAMLKRNGSTSRGSITQRYQRYQNQCCRF